MPRPRYDNVPPEKKQKLLDAAMREFGTHGYEVASINRILEAAQMSKGNFYYYFDDKDDLAATVLTSLAEPLATAFALNPVDSAEGFWVELRRVSHERLKHMEADRVKYEAMVRLSNAMVTRPALMEKVMPLFAPARMKMAGFLEEGVRVGALRSDLPLGTLMALIESVKTTLYKATFPGDGIPTDAQLEAFSDQVIDFARRIAAPSKER